MAVCRQLLTERISIHALREEGDFNKIHKTSVKYISIHALREEGDSDTRRSRGRTTIFLSTPSARRATSRKVGSQSPNTISIHALREEGDPGHQQGPRSSPNFYPRPPRGGRPDPAPGGVNPCGFLSTPSARRATRQGPLQIGLERFLSTPSARRATGAVQQPFTADVISIHALREEGDNIHVLYLQSVRNFYPRPPRGGRLASCGICGMLKLFLSTPSARRATQKGGFIMGVRANFYPRPPRGGRRSMFQRAPEGEKFLSTPSARRATSGAFPWRFGARISIHALREEGDTTPQKGDAHRNISIHALREEGDLCKVEQIFRL